MGSTEDYYYNEYLPNEIKKRKEQMVGKDEEPWTAIDLELRDEDFMKVAQEAHRRDITINKMVNIILKDGMRNIEYQFDHPPKPQLLNETE